MSPESLRKRYRNFSNEYDPRKVGTGIKVLFVAESPPKVKKGILDYFYNKDAQHRKGALWWHFNQALYGGNEPDKERFLSRFQKEGFFLIDVFLTKKELEDVRTDVKEGRYTNSIKASNRFFDRINELKPEKVIILGKGTAKLIAGSLPFRSQTNTERFKKFIKTSIKDL